MSNPHAAFDAAYERLERDEAQRASVENYRTFSRWPGEGCEAANARLASSMAYHEFCFYTWLRGYIIGQESNQARRR